MVEQLISVVLSNILHKFSRSIFTLRPGGALKEVAPAMNKKTGKKWETEPPTSFDQVICSIDADLLMADVAFILKLSIFCYKRPKL